ncbi:MAG: ISKra4 family transposase, partial [Anaerolinea sp.]|nr:ISKra4 family transposase [Anaerolinea sp.]
MELAIRTAMLRLGGSLLEDLLSLDTGHRGPRVDCGQGHGAAFVGYRPKGLDTVVGPVRLRRAWYHCGACHRGLAPRDAELGISGASLSPGLRAMVARVGSSEPFAQGRRDLAALAGLELSTKRVERSAEADGELVRVTTEAEA